MIYIVKGDRLKNQLTRAAVGQLLKKVTLSLVARNGGESTSTPPREVYTEPISNSTF